MLRILLLLQVLTDNKDKIDQKSMDERNALYWPISALRVLLKGKKNPEVGRRQRRRRRRRSRSRRERRRRR